MYGGGPNSPEAPRAGTVTDSGNGGVPIETSPPPAKRSYIHNVLYTYIYNAKTQSIANCMYRFGTNLK